MKSKFQNNNYYSIYVYCYNLKPKLIYKTHYLYKNINSIKYNIKLNLYKYIYCNCINECFLFNNNIIII